MSQVADSRHRLNKKLKFAVGRAKASKVLVKSIDRSKMRGSEVKGRSVRPKTDAATLYDSENGGKRISRSAQEGYEREVFGKRRFGPVSSDPRRKRLYADRNVVDGERKSHNVEVPNRLSSFKEGRYSRGGDSVKKEKGSIDGKPYALRGRKSFKDEFNEGRSDKKALRSLVYNGRVDAIPDGKCFPRHRVENRVNSVEVSDDKPRTKAKTRDRWVSAKEDGGKDDSLKKHTKSKSDSSNNLDGRQNRRQVGSLEKSIKKKLRDKKGLDDDSVDAPPKKKKRVIRIDPHDISNKRLDDSISTDDSNAEKKVDIEKNIEVSKNALFRAIQPSTSILSFVEENFLGRRRLIELRRSGYNIDLSAPLDNVPFSTSSERERIEESVFRNKLTFFAAAKISSSFPPPDLPEIAFAGKSNVGKSSLLNALTRQWGVVRVSDKPGLTQTINFFQLGSKHCLVDLPGYGFAYAKEEVKDAWEELVKEYVSTRLGLKRVCLLIDTKWGMKPRDHELINLMERSQTKYQIVLTKTDMVFPIDVARRAMQIEESLKANKSLVQPVMMVSSQTGAGIRSLRAVLAKITRFAKL